MIHEEICTYEVCKLAQEKGFPLQKVIKQDGRAFFYELPQTHPDWASCDAWYIPTQSLLQRWLREEKEVFVEVHTRPHFATTHTKTFYVWSIQYYDRKQAYRMLQDPQDTFYTYELALEDALKYALENLL